MTATAQKNNRPAVNRGEEKLSVPSEMGNESLLRWDVACRELKASFDRLERARRELKDAQSHFDGCDAGEKKAAAEFRDWMQSAY